MFFAFFLKRAKNDFALDEYICIYTHSYVLILWSESKAKINVCYFIIYTFAFLKFEFYTLSLILFPPLSLSLNHRIYYFNIYKTQIYMFKFVL